MLLDFVTIIQYCCNIWQEMNEFLNYYISTLDKFISHHRGTFNTLKKQTSKPLQTTLVFCRSCHCRLVGFGVWHMNGPDWQPVWKRIGVNGSFSSAEQFTLFIYFISEIQIQKIIQRWTTTDEQSSKPEKQSIKSKGKGTNQDWHGE